MPRSDKPISRGSLTEPMASARGRTWRSHAGPEESEQFEPDGQVMIDPITQETVEAVVDLVDPGEPSVTVRTPEHVETGPQPEYEWVSVRSIDDRTYTRVDVRQIVAEE